VFTGVQAVQEFVVVGDDLLEAECARVSRHVAVGSEDDVITEADRAARGRINTVLRHASADDNLLDARALQVGIKGGPEECVASAFVDDDVAGLR
jgi:hypothetical protein